MKKAIVAVLLILGIALICLSLVLAIVSTSNTNIIGGADLATFQYYFFKQNSGLYFWLSCAGAACIAAGAIVNIIKNK